MKGAAFVVVLAIATLLHAHAADTNPVEKVLQLLSDLQTKIIAEGADSQKRFDEYSEWCEDRSKNLGFEIKTGKAEVAELTATIEHEEAVTAELNSKVEDLAGSVATDEADLKAAGEIRDKEAADFVAEEKELVDVISMIERAIAILEREMQKGGASMLQLKNAGGLVQALRVMVQAHMVSSADASTLTAFVQNSQASDDGDDDVGAPAAAVYENQSGNIVETLQSLLEKAEAQLDEARKTETTNKNNYEMLKQSLTDAVKFANKDMAEAKAGIASSGQAKAAAEGDLAVTSADLKEDEATKADLHHNCMTKAQDFEAEVKSRDEELKAIAEAKKIISETSGGADTITYGLAQVSLLQTARTHLSSGSDLAKFEAVRFVRDLARKQNSPLLAQLASRMESAMRFGTAAGEDPFAKVKGLITDLIARLEEDAAADASHKAYCDKELSETRAKKADKTAEIEKLTTKIDQASARSAQLKEEVAALQKALAELAAAQAEMDKMRHEENEAYKKNRAEMEEGLEGVKMALKVLRDYYAKEDKAHVAAEGGAAGVIGLLEVIESDFSKTLAEIVTTEESAQATYDQETKENEIERVTKEQDVKYKSQESTGLDKAVAELSSDRSNVEAELDAVLEYLKKIEEQCIAKAETYAERKRRREAEIAGLKEALKILSGEAVLIQQTSRRILRGVGPHVAA